MTIRTLVFALIPTLVLFAALEGAARLWGLADPSLGSIPLPEEYSGLLRTDAELFWAVQPDLAIELEGASVTTNADGLRSPPLSAKSDGELRILSLGESTTFGVRVDDDETYSARLEAILARRAGAPGTPFQSVRVLNAGVPAWSSFQSLQYLKRRGIALEPDLVLFYHELNDYMPSSLRDSSNDEIGLSLTDRELHRSRRAQLDRRLLDLSALYRFLVLRRARERIAALQQGGGENALVAIGLPGIGIPKRAVSLDEEELEPSGLDENALPSRVSPEERVEILSELVSFCRANGIRLAILHPSYRDSRPHACNLTRFCRERDVPMFETQPVLHPPRRPRGARYVDPWHPNVEGHAAIAKSLASWLDQQRLLVPTR